MDGFISYGDQRIKYRVILSTDLSSKIRIHVHPNGTVEVEAPLNKEASEIGKAVYKRARWISHRLAEGDKVRQHSLAREYISGETHFYLGRRYQLKILETVDRKSSVAMKGSLLRIELPKADRAAIKRRLNAWYKQRASEYFSRRLNEISAKFSWLENKPPLKLVTMKKQWGSCSPTGSINLNPWLIRSPRECIDYVITHELCHLQEHNHSPRFYDLLDRQMPDWRRIKFKLDGMAELILAE